MASDKDVPPVSPGASFGDELRKEREIRGISLAEIAEATKVSKRFLGAIEKDDFAALPAPVFTRGFVREYARYLGLNADEMVTRYAHFVDARGQIAEDDPLPLRSSDKPVKSSEWDRSRKPLLLFLLLVLIVALIAGGWFAISKYRNQPVVSPPPEIGAAPAAAPIEPPPSGERAPDSDRFSITLRASEDVWVVLNADGQRILSETMRSGEDRSFDAATQFEFETIGNASGLTVSLNGVELPPLGQSGQVIRNRVFTREDAVAMMRTPTTSS